MEPPAASEDRGRRPWTTTPEPALDLVLDGPSLRALAHPVRVRIIGILRREGPSTASRLAEQLGLNSGATSYHLRQLADAGLVLEAEELGNRRDRWWKAAHRSTFFEPESYDTDPEAAMAYLNAIASGYARRVIEFAEVLPTLPKAWFESATMSDFRLRITPAEGARLIDELASVIASYRREDDVLDGTVAAPDESARVVVHLQVMPEIDLEPTPSDDDSGSS